VIKISQQVYNVTSFSLSAQQIYEIVMQAFPQAQITFEPDPRRQKIVDTWPEDVDDSAARSDWNWEPEFGLDRAFQGYLIPKIKERYAHKAEKVDII